MAEHNEIGKIGEKIVKDFLFRHGYIVICANFWTKFGEIDLIAEKDKHLHFIEVKSVKVKSFDHVTSLHVKPEDNLTEKKWGKLVTSINIYLKNHYVSPETKWQIDLACVYIQTERRQGKVVLMDNVHKD